MRDENRDIINSFINSMKQSATQTEADHTPVTNRLQKKTQKNIRLP